MIHRRKETTDAKSKTYSQIVFRALVLISVICTLLCGSILSIFFLTKMASYDEQYNISSAKNAKDEMEQIINNTLVTSCQISWNATVQKYSRIHNRTNYREISEISDLLYQTCTSLSDYVDSLYVIYPERNMAITSYGFYAWDSFCDKGWLPQPMEERGIQWIGERTFSRSGYLTNAVSEPVVTAVQPIFTYSHTSPSAYIVTNIRQSAINSMIKGGMYGQSHVLVVGEESQLLFHSDPLSPEEYNMEYLPELQDLPSLKKSIFWKDSVPYRLAEIDSPFHGWTFLVFSPLSDLYQTALWGILIVCVTILITVLSAVILSARLRASIYRPVEELMSGVTGNQQTDLAESEYTEFQKIHQNFNQIKTENKLLEAHFEKITPYLQEKFFFELLAGQIVDPLKIQQKMETLRLSEFPCENYVVSVVKIIKTHIEKFDLHQSRSEIQCLVVLALQEQMKQLCARAKIFMRDVSLNQDQIYFIFGYTGEEAEPVLLKLHEELVSYSSSALDSSIMVGISCPVQGLESLQISSNQALEIVEQNYIYGNSQIVFYHQVAPNMPPLYLNPLSYEKALTSAIRNYQTETIRSILTGIHDMIERSGYGIRMIRQFYIGIINMIFLLGHDGENENGDTLSLSFHQIISQIYQMDQLSDIHQFVLELCMQTTKNFANKQNTRSSHLADEIIEYIQQNYSQDLSLEQLAKKFSYTSPYINKILKSCTNSTFYDILSEVRIRNAKTMLEEGKLTISQIAQAVGYNNTQSFIRMFKKMMDVTPGQYRQNAQEGCSVPPPRDE